MYKVYSSCLLFTTLVFSSAHAPTFHLWRNLAAASAEADSAPLTDSLDSHASFYATDAFAASHEYAEDNDLKRFGLDEFYLPKLEVDEPELFNWSEVERTYLADNTLPISFDYLDSAMSAAFRNGGASARRQGGAGFGNLTSGGASGGSPNITSSSASSKVASTQANEAADDESTPAIDNSPVENDGVPNEQNGPKEDDSVEQTQENQFAQNDPDSNDLLPIHETLPVITIPTDYTIVDEQKPVQVPAPGAFGLFVLGLAGLRFVGRKKNGSG
jgi:hypothetical protein